MPITVIGRPSKFCGKTFFEILCNLKDFGVGRVVIRTAFLRYEEPTYYRVVKAEPAMDENFKMGKIWAEQIFRGRNFGVIEVLSGHKYDFRLIPKEQEKAFCEASFSPLETRILPEFSEFPPLLRAKIEEERAARGEPYEIPKLKMVYSKNPLNRNRIAGEGETPNVNFNKNVSSNLYQDVIDKRKTLQ